MSSEELTQIDQELTKAATNMEYKALSSKVPFMAAMDSLFSPNTVESENPKEEGALIDTATGAAGKAGVSRPAYDDFNWAWNVDDIFSIPKGATVLDKADQISGSWKVMLTSDGTDVLSYHFSEILALAIIPAVVLIFYVYRKDTIEKEPLRLLVILCALGCASAFISYFIQIPIVTEVWESTGRRSLIGTFLTMGILVPVIEEGLKFLVLIMVTWNQPAFNYVYDGLVYAVVISLGFAATENIQYIYLNGLASGIFRAVTVVAMHCMVAVYMGAAYGNAKKSEGDNNHINKNKHIALAFLVPMIMHGAYDFVASMKGRLWIMLFFLLQVMKLLEL